MPPAFVLSLPDYFQFAQLDALLYANRKKELTVSLNQAKAHGKKCADSLYAFFLLSVNPASSTRPGTRANSLHYSSPARHRRRWCVLGNGGVVEPIGVPARRRATLISVAALHRGAVPGQDGIEPAQNASINCRRGRGEAFGPVAPKRISE